MDTKHRIIIEQIVLVGLVLFFVTGWRLFPCLSLVLLFALLAWPRWLVPLAQEFDRVTSYIGNLVGRLILAVVFFIFFTPYALLVRKFKPDIRAKFFSVPKESAFMSETKKYAPADFENAW